MYGMDGSTLVFDTDDQHCHELATHTGSVNISNRQWRATTGDSFQSSSFTLATAHPQATFIYGRAKLTWNTTESSPLPTDRWYDTGGTIVVEHLCFRDAGGNYAYYPSSLYTLLFRLTSGTIYLDAKSTLCNDYIALLHGGAAYAGLTVQYVIHSAAFT